MSKKQPDSDVLMWIGKGQSETVTSRYFYVHFRGLA
jgi:hypothetical protein